MIQTKNKQISSLQQPLNSQKLVNTQDIRKSQNMNNVNNVNNLTKQETLSYNNWKKNNLQMSQMVQTNGQIHVEPQYRKIQQFNQNTQNEDLLNEDLLNEDLNNFNLQETYQNDNLVYEKTLPNRAKYGLFMNNESNRYSNYTTVKAKNVTSALAIRKSRNSESSFL